MRERDVIIVDHDALYLHGALWGRLVFGETVGVEARQSHLKLPLLLSHDHDDDEGDDYGDGDDDALYRDPHHRRCPHCRCPRHDSLR